MIYRKVVKRVNPVSSYYKENFFSFFLFFFLLYQYEKMDISWPYCDSHFTIYVNVYSGISQLLLNKAGGKVHGSSRLSHCECSSWMACPVLWPASLVQGQATREGHMEFSVTSPRDLGTGKWHILCCSILGPPNAFQPAAHAILFPRTRALHMPPPWTPSSLSCLVNSRWDG